MTVCNGGVIAGRGYKAVVMHTSAIERKPQQPLHAFLGFSCPQTLKKKQRRPSSDRVHRVIKAAVSTCSFHIRR